MARKNSFVHELTSEAVPQSLAASFNTDPTIVSYEDNISYQINVTTSNSEGTFAVQASLDYKVYAPSGEVLNPGTWVDLILSGGVPTVAAANDSILIDLNQLPYTAIRLAYNSTTAGTGTCRIFVGARQLGG